MKNHLRAGIDYIFTYGPLGYFVASIYDHNLFWAAYFWEIIVKLFFVFYLVRLFNRSAYQPAKIISLLLFILFLPFCQVGVQYFAFLTLIGIRISDLKNSWSDQILNTMLLSIFSLAKFLFFLLALVILLLSEFRYRTERPRTIFSPLLLFVIFFCLAWSALRQSILDIPTYMYASFQIVVGFNDAMAITGSLPEMFLSIAVLSLISTTILQLFCAKQNGKSNKILFFILQTCLLLLWKQGFVRQDFHSADFFGYALFLSLLLPIYFVYSSQRSKLKRILISTAILFSILGSIVGLSGSQWFAFVFGTSSYGLKQLVSSCLWRIENNVRTLTTPFKTRQWMDNRLNALRSAEALSLILSRIKNDRVDAFSFEQAVVLLNGMNWRPRPVFQSYSAYTPYLAIKNSQFFQAATAPDYVLFKLQTTDTRLPSLDDNLALLEIFHRYVPDATEKSFLLLKKKIPNVNPKHSTGGKLIQREVISFNQEFQINEEASRYQTLELDINETLLGKIRKFLYKPPPVYITIKAEPGNTVSYRLITNMARQPFLINPLLQKTGDVIQIYGPRRGTRAKTFALSTDSPGMWFKDEITIAVRKIPNLISQKQYSSAEASFFRDLLDFGLSYGSFDFNKAGETYTSPVLLHFTGGANIGSGYLALFGSDSLTAQRVILDKGNYQFILFGYGTKAGNEFPKMTLLLNDRTYTFSVDEKNAYIVPFHIEKKEEVRFSLQFVNDAVVGNQDRNVFIKAVYIVPSQEALK